MIHYCNLGILKTLDRNIGNYSKIMDIMKRAHEDFNSYFDLMKNHLVN